MKSPKPNKVKVAESQAQVAQIAESVQTPRPALIQLDQAIIATERKLVHLTALKNSYLDESVRLVDNVRADLEEIMKDEPPRF
jgi:hypothetical protein